MSISRTRSRCCSAAAARLALIPRRSGSMKHQVAKVTEFFDNGRQYQKERTANLPGFKRDLKYEAMLPVLEGKVPVAVPAARERAIHDAIAFADKRAHQDRDSGAAGAG